MRDVEFLLVGGGLASAYCAAELRRCGAKGSILLVGREPEPPYERPPLSKEYLRGEAQRADAFVHEPGWYEENDVELLVGKSVMSLDAEGRVAKIQGGEEVRFDKALLATGAMVNLLRVDGAQLDGIHYLRAFGNSDSIRDDLAAAGAERVALIGGSFIGAEVAASLTAEGFECAIVEQEPVMFARNFGEPVGRYIESVLRARGVEIHAGSGIEAFEGDERVAAVLLENGSEVTCDAVVIGVGVRPDTMLAGRAGLEVGDGIVCDSGLETSLSGVFAAGDCCNWQSPLHGEAVRLEHWDVALQQGRHAARGMLGDKRPYEVVPYFFSDLADWLSLEYVGTGSGDDELIVRGEIPAEGGPGEFSAWYVRDGRLRATLSIGRGEDLVEARRLIDAKAAIGEAERKLIEDPGGDLSALG